MIRGLLIRLGAWQGGTVHRKIVSAAAIVAAFTLLAKVVGAAREVVVAQQFGTSPDVDAFLIALTLPSFVTMVLGAALNYALLPAYVEVRQREGQEAAQRLLSTALLLSLAMLGGTTLLIGLAAPVLLPLLSRFSAAQARLTLELTYLLLPTIVLSGVTLLWTAVLNAHGRYARPAVAGLALPLAAIAVLVLFGRTVGVRALALGTVGGHLIETMLVGAAVHEERLQLLPRWYGLTSAVRRMFGQLGPAAGGVVFTSVNPVIDQMMAARIGPGSVAALGYGNKLVAFIAGILGTSLGAAVLPHFSKLAGAKDWPGLDRTIRTYMRAMTVVAIPITVAMIALSAPLVRVLFQRGAFTASDTADVARIQALYALQIPFRMASLVLVRFIIASAENRALMAFSVCNAVVNVLGNWILSAWLGTAGIALSTSLVYAFSFGLNLWLFRRRMRGYLAAPTPLGEATAA